MQRSRYLRLAEYAAAAAAFSSFVRGLLVYGGEVSAPKTILFVIVNVGWFIVFPAVDGIKELFPVRNKLEQMSSEIRVLLFQRVFPSLIIIAFIWMTCTTWEHSDSAYGLREFFNELESKQVPAR